jgi:spoIIIJ-associated protein
MEEYIFTGKNVSEALTKATAELGVVSTNLTYDVLEKGSAGFIGIGSKDAKIQITSINGKSVEPVFTDDLIVNPVIEEANSEFTSNETENKPVEEEKSEEPAPKIEVQENISDALKAQEEKEEYKESAPRERKEPTGPSDPSVVPAAEKFLNEVFDAMKIEVKIDSKLDAENNTLSIDLSGDEMGMLIGKRGQTLDSLQYLTSLVINKGQENYTRVKVDTEDYRERRKATLENLAKNVAGRVKRTHRSVSLESMNPYERRIIHYALQDNPFVNTHSEGEEPYRHVVVTPKKNISYNDYE